MQGILRVKQNGEKNVAELCSVTWWKIFRLELPNWHCVERVINPSSTIQTEVVFTIDVWVGLLFVLCAGILVAIIVELLYNKADVKGTGNEYLWQNVYLIQEIFRQGFRDENL